MYVCGVTPYNVCHLGHARAYVSFDVIKKYLKYSGYEVKHVQNFTDIDDKLIAQANAEGTDIFQVANKYIETYFADMDALGIQRADIYPRVTENVSEIVGFVAKLIEKGHAYHVDGDVYYDVASFESYGNLSGRDIEDMKAGARVDINDKKHSPVDFALWKSAKPGEPSWESPWGAGRPGWHIECSVLANKYLGATFDIHGGGADLIFPHHENEIAQSEAYTGQSPLAKYWLHNGFVMIESEKMSKSLNNFFTIRDVLKVFHPRILRFFMLSTQYRNPIDFTSEKLDESKRALHRIISCYENLTAIVDGNKSLTEGAVKSAVVDKAIHTFKEAMDDDFNTALAIGGVFDVVRDVNSLIASFNAGKAEGTVAEMHAWKAFFKEVDSVLGIIGTDEAKVTCENDRTVELMELMMEIRTEARTSKNWALSDMIRDRLNEIGYLVEDTPQGCKYRITK